MRTWYRLFLFSAAVGCCAAQLQAQLPILNHANGDVTATTQSAGDNRGSRTEAAKPSTREEVAEKLRVAQRTLESAKDASDQANAKPPERLQREVDLLQQRDSILAQLEVAKKENADQRTRLNDLQSQLETVRADGPPEKRPYSFLLLDHLRDDLTARKARTETVEAAATSATEAVTRAKQNMEAKEQAFLRAKELELANNTTAEKKAELANARKLAENEFGVATDSLALKKQEKENQQLAIELHKKQVELLEEKIKWISEDNVFSQQDLLDQTIEIAKQIEDLTSELKLAERLQAYADGEWSRVRQQYDTSTEKNVELVEQLETKQLKVQFHQTQVALLNARLERRRMNKKIWERRYQVIREEAKTEDLITWDNEARAYLEQLERDNRLDQMRIDELRQDLVRLDRESQAASEDAGQIRRWIQEQRDTLGQMIQIHDANIVSIAASRRLTDKLVAEIEGDVMRWSFSEWMESFWIYAGKVWNQVLIKDPDHPLTVGKVIVGVLLVFFGFIAARMLSRTLGYRLQRGRIRMNESGAAAIQSLSFYVLLVCFTWTALTFANVPMTMFTFLGGAVAIGIGFGSQNVVNNFISGLILLAERPIKVGDLIQIGDLFGNVEHIGARSTVIRTGNNLDIIVPNSTFLENNVVNLTRGDDKLRTHVTVGIAYGSPTRDASKLMKHAAVEHGRVLNTPEPFVWFTEFGDNSLNFEVHFWVKVRSIADRTRIESDLRFSIDQLFREAGITIAFPQRDVHFDVAKPIPVQVIRTNDPYDTSGVGAA